MRWTLAILALCCATASAQDPKQRLDAKVKLLPVPAHGTALAAADAKNIAEGKDPITSAVELPFVRYLWGQDLAQERNWRATVFAVQLLSQVSAQELKAGRPVVLHGGQLLRVNLARLAPDSKTLQQLLVDWEALRFAPEYGLLVTKDALNNAGLQGFEIRGEVEVVVRSEVWDAKLPGEWIDKGGVKHKGGWRKELSKKRMSAREALKEADVVRLPSEHAGPEHAALSVAVGSEAPVMDYRYFCWRAMRSIQDKGVFRDVYSGVYYELSGIQAIVNGRNGNQTDEDALFGSLGIKIESKKNGRRAFSDFYDALGSDRLSVLSRSSITGRVRAAVEVPIITLQRPRQGVLFYTFDVNEEDIDLGQDLLANLLTIHDRDRAREGFFTRRSGLPGAFLIKSDDGSLQREAPIQVVTDDRIPRPHPPRLQPIMSCIGCHAENDFWKPFGNDVLKIAKTYDIFGDTSELNVGISDTVRKIARKFNGEFEGSFKLLRNDYAASVLEAVGPWSTDAKNAWANVGKIAGAELTRIVHEYGYQDVTAHIALRELGFDVPEADALRYLNLLLPPTGVAVGGIFPEDPRIVKLKSGVNLGRYEFGLVYASLANRVAVSLSELQRRAAAQPQWREVVGADGERYFVRVKR